MHVLLYAPSPVILPLYLPPPALDYSQCVHKMRLLTLASMAVETSQVSFSDLTVELDLQQDEVEVIVIEGQLKCVCGGTCANVYVSEG